MTQSHSPGRYGREDFVRLTLAEFPELREDFEDDSDLPHLQASALARLTQTAKGNADWTVYARAVQLVHHLFTNADEYLQNALAVSYLENLDFDGRNGDVAWTHLSPLLRDEWRKLNGYLGRRVPRSAE